MQGHVRKQRGLALIMVLWSMVLLSLLAAMVMQRSSADLRLARNLAAAAEAELAADAAVRLAAARILSGNEPWPPDPAPQAQTFAGVRIDLRIEDEMARVDLNAAEPALLAALMIELGVQEEEAARLSAAIADYRDSDALVRDGGAEDPDYLAAGLPLGARDSYFRDPAELARVIGVPAALHRAMAPYLTTLSGLPDPATWSASETVQRALARRQAARSAIAEPRRRLLVLRGGAERETPPRLVRIIADARTASGGRFVREAVFVLRADEGVIQIQHWRRGRVGDRE